jgi:septal ring factor EnvC (AmiA/AmiB activator)
MDPMRLPERLDMPLKRLAAALDHLEAAAERRAESDAHRADLEEEFAVMQDDRARLGLELDTAATRIRKLEDANTEVARRLAATGASIRGLLGQDEPEPDAAPSEKEA